jgi:hypothetical protein
MCADDTLVLIQYAHGRIVQIDFAEIHVDMDHHSQRKMDQKHQQIALRLDIEDNYCKNSYISWKMKTHLNKYNVSFMYTLFVEHRILERRQK